MSIWGTSWHGDFVTASEEELEELFEVPIDGDFDKTTWEWDLLYDEKIPFSIYDYKWHPRSTREKVSFHIGTKTSEESKIISNYIKSLLK